MGHCRAVGRGYTGVALGEVGCRKHVEKINQHFVVSSWLFILYFILQGELYLYV
jgi:hypothetical protein